MKNQPVPYALIQLLLIQFLSIKNYKLMRLNVLRNSGLLLAILNIFSQNQASVVFII